MDSHITAAAEALSMGDPLSALKKVALRDDAQALALRGIAMAQLGDMDRAKVLLRNAERAFGETAPVSRARCRVAIAEIALVLRDLGRPMEGLISARDTLEKGGDYPNAAHAGYLEARRLLLLGRLFEAEQLLGCVEANALSPVSKVGYELVTAGIAIRRVNSARAVEALERAKTVADSLGIGSLKAEINKAKRAIEEPVARLLSAGNEEMLHLVDVERLFASDAIIIDACRGMLRIGTTHISLVTRPVLFSLVKALGEAWPYEVSRRELLNAAFQAKEADESHRARLRVEVTRLRKALQSIADISATRNGFVLKPTASDEVVVIAPPFEVKHEEILALLADGEAWSSSALATVMQVSPRTVQRALEALSMDGWVESFGRGRSCRWIASNVPSFPTCLLLPIEGIS